MSLLKNNRHILTTSCAIRNTTNGLLFTILVPHLRMCSSGNYSTPCTHLIPECISTLGTITFQISVRPPICNIKISSSISHNYSKLILVTSICFGIRRFFVCKKNRASRLVPDDAVHMFISGAPDPFLFVQGPLVHGMSCTCN